MGKFKNFYSKLSSIQRLFTMLLILLLQFSFLSVNAQTKIIKGTVKDKKGALLGGVSISVKGDEKSGTATDEKGQFTIIVPGPSAVIVFSNVGFANKEETVGTRIELNVILEESINDLNEVVVIGYGTQKKRDVTGAITSVSAKSIEERQPVSIFDALLGAAPGVRVMSASGAPGEEADITIRGMSTLSDAGVRPLYVVDGVPMNNINAINPKDIQSMEILKDAASAAIYGSRSANGVIIITTKNGELGKPQINIDILRSYSRLSNQLPQANRLERVIFDRRNNLGLDPRFADSTSFARNADNNYQEIMTQTAVRNQVDIGIRGGTNNLKYFNSIQFLDETGIVLTSYNKRVTLRTNVEYKPSKKVTLSTRLNFSYQDRNNISEGNVIQQALQRPPNFALNFPNGEPIYINGGRRNPVQEALLRQNTTSIFKGVLYQAFDYQLSKSVRLHLDGSADVELRRTNIYNSRLLSNANPPISTGRDQTAVPIRLQGNAYVSYKKTFGRSHNVTGLAGTNIERNRREDISIGGQNFVSEAVRTLNAAGIYDLPNTFTTRSGSSLVGFYARAGYDFRGKYLLNATVRRDGSSVFGSENRWGNFPSLSAGWRFSDEKFIPKKLARILTDGKLRMSWGMTGNQEIGDYDAIPQYVFGSSFYNGVSGVRTDSRLGNPLLKWEATTQTNIGLDLTFLGGRISFVGDYFVKTTTDLLYDSPIPTEVGFSSVRTNFGSMENRGIELMVTAYPIRKKDFTWMTSVNYTRIRNKILSLPQEFIDDIWSVRVGQEAGNFFGYKYLGIYQWDQSNAYTQDFRTRLTPVFQRDAQGNVMIQRNMQPILLGYNLPNGQPYTGVVRQKTALGVVLRGGDVIWDEVADEKGEINGNIGNEDRQFIGHGQPRWSIGWNNNINFKGFYLSANFYGNFGNMVYNENRRNLQALGVFNITPEAPYVYELWKYPGQITREFQGRDRVTDNMRRGSSQFLENASFVRLQALRIGYQVPQKIAEKAKLRSLNVYLYGTNIFTWTSYGGFDPEVGQRSVIRPGNDPGRFPRRREFGMGLNVTF